MNVRKIFRNGILVEHIVNRQPETILGHPKQSDQWPVWAKIARQLRNPEDKGVGDVIARTYAKINVRREYGKMCAWCKIRQVDPTHRRFINWLNKTEIPLNTAHAARVDYKRNHAPPPNEPTEAEVNRAREIARKETEALRQKLRA